MDELELPLPLPLGAVAEEGEMAKEGEKGVWGLAPGEEDWVEDVEGWCACPTGPGAGCGEAEVSMCGPEEELMGMGAVILGTVDSGETGREAGEERRGAGGYPSKDGY